MEPRNYQIKLKNLNTDPVKESNKDRKQEELKVKENESTVCYDNFHLQSDCSRDSNMASSPRDLPTLLSVLGISEEGLSDVSEQQVDNALQKKGIDELEECRRVKSAWKRQQQRSGVLFKFVFAFLSIHARFVLPFSNFLASFSV